MTTKQIALLADGRLELRYAGQLVGYAITEAEARETLNAIAYDAERGRPPVVYLVAEEPAAVTEKRQPFSDGDGEYTTFAAGDVELAFEDNGDSTLVFFNTVFDIRYNRTERWEELRAMARLLSDPRVQAHLGLRPAVLALSLDKAA